MTCEEMSNLAPHFDELQVIRVTTRVLHCCPHDPGLYTVALSGSVGNKARVKDYHDHDDDPDDEHDDDDNDYDDDEVKVRVIECLPCDPGGSLTRTLEGRMSKRNWNGL